MEVRQRATTVPLPAGVLDEGTQWVVFEPNDTSLWAKIRRNVTAFLTNVWRSGALFGATPQEAFYVRCDETPTRRTCATRARW